MTAGPLKVLQLPPLPFSFNLQLTLGDPVVDSQGQTTSDPVSLEIKSQILLQNEPSHWSTTLKNFTGQIFRLPIIERFSGFAIAKISIFQNLPNFLI